MTPAVNRAFDRWLDRAAARRPGTIALETGAERFTYAELRTRAGAVAAALAAATLIGAPATAVADEDDEDQDVRARTACLGGRMELALESEEDGDEIDIGLRVDAGRPVYVWRTVLIHERRLVYQGTRRYKPPRYSLRLYREIPDWRGRQTVVARVSAGDGTTCRLELTF
jgi:hypothetical protein